MKDYQFVLVKKKHRKAHWLLQPLVCCFLVLVLSFPLSAQDSSSGKKTVTGTVVDSSTGEPVIGASIIAEKDQSIGTVSDFEGKFQLSLPPNVTVLHISYLGYTTQKVELKGRTRLEITLQEDLKMLSEIVVVGYGSQRKETLTGAITTLESRELLQSPTGNISNALVGRIPGITAVQSSGEPGRDASTIRIRGISTLNSEGLDPLIVIDGVQSTSSMFNALDANEIENISVLKDASSTAVYGVKGANGVIIVTTKKGESGKPKVNMSYRYGVSQISSKLDMLGSYEYAIFRNEAIDNDKATTLNGLKFTETELWKFRYNRDYTPNEVDNMANLTPEQKTALINSPALYYVSHDFFDEFFGGSAPQQQFNVNVSGGNERMRYFTSVGYFSQDGIFQNAEYAGKNVNSAYDRYNIRTNINVDVFKNLEMSVQFGGQFENRRGILGDNNSTDEGARHKRMLVMILAAPPFSAGGISSDGRLINALEKDTHPFAGKGGGGESPISYLLGTPIQLESVSNLNTTASLKHKMDYLTKGFSVSGTVSYNDTYRKGIIQNQTIPRYTARRDINNNPNDIIYVGGITGPTSITDNSNNSKWSQLYLEGKVNYERTFDKHAVTGMILYNAQQTKDPNLAYHVPAGLLGLAGRLTYMYDERYLAEVNMGYNGSENFPPGKRFGFFPAYSLGWIVTNESFFPKNDWLTWMKIRGSYGEVGNDKVGKKRFLYLPSTWALSNGYYFGNTNGTSSDPRYPGAYESFVGNPDVTWERSKKANIGVDINFFKDRLSFTGDLFHEKRDNILWDLGTIPGIVAATLPPANIGKVSNKGYDLQINWRDKIRHFTYGLGANVSYARNVIEFMDEPDYPYEWMNKTGFSLGQYKGYKSDGFYNSNMEASNRPYGTVDNNKVQPGDIRYVDIDGDGKIDINDQVPVGYSNLPKYAFGGTINLGYKGFSISALFTGSYMGTMPMSSFYILNPFYQQNGGALQFQYDGRWTPEKAEQGIEPTFPRASLNNFSTQNAESNDLWLRSSEFFRLKNLEIGYEFKHEALKRVGMSSARIYVSGNNLHTWGSKLINGYDPEQLDANGAADGYLYPPTQSYNIGVNIHF